MGKKTLEQKAKEKMWELRSKEAVKVASELLVAKDSPYVSNESYISDLKREFAKYILYIPRDITPEKATRKYFSRLLKKIEGDNPRMRGGRGRIFIRVFVAHMHGGLFNEQEFSGWAQADVLDNLSDSSFRSYHILKRALRMGIPFSQMQMVRGRDPYQKKDSLRLFVFDTSSEFIHSLIKDVFANSSKFRVYACKHEDHLVTRRFQESFGDLPMPANIMEFTPDTFCRQVMFFQHEGKREDVGAIKAMYAHIVQNLQGDKTPFTLENGADLAFIDRTDVVNCVQEGYRTVVLSSLKEIPSFDNWLVAADAQSGVCSDVLRKNRLSKCSFRDIPDEYKAICKRWFIFCNGIALVQKVKYLPHIRRFLLGVEESRRTIRPLREGDCQIMFRDVSTFISISRDGKIDETARCSVMNFLTYVKKTNEVTVDPACFKYLPARNTKTDSADDENVISKDDYSKLMNGLHEISRKEGTNPIYRISFAVFVVLSLMELRVTSVLSLKTSDIRECGLGQYCITVATKTSRSHKKTYGIPRLVYEVFSKVIEYTADYRENVPLNVRDMVFITPNGKVISASAINRVLKKVCNELGIKEYTCGNIRKTYMTNVAQSIRKSGGSAVGLEQLFDHKSVETTFRAYAKISEEEILMTISNTEAVRPKDKVKSHIKQRAEYGKAHLVSDGAGYCQQETCHIYGMADCFVCPHFVTTLDCYDSFVLKREKMKRLLETEGFGEEIREGYLLILKMLDMYISEMDEIRSSNGRRVE